MSEEKKSKLTVDSKTDKGHSIKFIVLLNFGILIYSASGIFSKTAARQPFFSLTFVFFYGMMLIMLAVYAVIWQQVIKKIPLTLAYANRAVSIVWSIIFGTLLFKETPTTGRLIGAAIVVIGVIIYSILDEDGECK